MIYRLELSNSFIRARKKPTSAERIWKSWKLWWINLLRAFPCPRAYRDHVLIGDYIGCRECHIEPDWLLPD